jgi:DHA2 family multidrug resistance protein-like MFS transporter
MREVAGSVTWMPTGPESDAPPRATRREWVGLAVLALPCLLYSMDLEVLYLAAPSIAADLDPTGTQMLWIVDIYGFLLAGSLITMGTLGDRIGRRRVLMWGAAAFGVASVLAAFSPSAETLIASRALLGVAGATLAPSTLSLIRNMFHDDRQRTVAVSVWATCFSVGAVMGPLVGGVLLEYFWWGSVFLVAVPIMAVILIVGPLLLPEFRDPQAGRMDILSAAMSIVAVLSVIYGLKETAVDGLSARTAVSIVVGIGVGGAFAIRQLRLEDPLVDLSLFRTRAFTAALSANGLSIFVVAGLFLFMTQYLQLVADLSPLHAGLWTIPSGVALIIGSMLAPLLSRSARPGYAMALGLAVVAVGCVPTVWVTASADRGIALLVIGSVVLCLGAAPVVTLSTDAVVSSAPAGRAGSAASMSETSIELGGALGIAVLGSIGVAVYRSQLSDSMPASLSGAQASSSLDTLGAARDVAHTVGGRVGSNLLDAAHSAFASGLAVVSVVAAVVMAALAVAAVAFLRDIAVSASAPEPDLSTTAHRDEADREARQLDGQSTRLKAD